MKKLVFAGLGLGLILASCQEIGGMFKNDAAHEAKDSARANLPVIERDAGITEANAYSDLFLDSTYIEQFIRNRQLNDSMARDLRNFYNARNLQYAWFASDGMTEQGRGLWTLRDSVRSEGTKRNREDSLQGRIDSLAANDSLRIARNDTSFVQAELMLTERFIRFARNSAAREMMGRRWYTAFVPARKMNALELADSLAKSEADQPNLAPATADSSNRNASEQQAYDRMQTELSRYADLVRKGGWQPVNLAGIKLVKGRSHPAVVALKKRLQLSGDYTGKDTSAVYNDSLIVAVRSFQARHGFREDGMVNDSLVQVMNIPAEQRLQQLLVNMNRLLWMPEPSNGKAIQVNIPSYMLHYYADSGKAFDMEVVVGKEGANTVMFSGKLNQIVFSPYWNIPASIVQNEILPAMKSNKQYLSQRNMEVVNDKGDVPVIRQKPGKDNALGRVKFLFPNSYDIYLHDTPDKGLFNRDQRALSHGCIRVADAEKLATHLLQSVPGWTPERIRQAMNSGQEQTVKLENGVPVNITYLTAWVDEQGRLQFRNDIYGHDQRTAARMFVPAKA
ncbi:MAG TPA: L,D-transpeptidase family protein [Chitinophagaceae bacterium]|jgi:murein L,D-transpeptidase YcbB/YkuD|nr:L,D-transpeptidase family protein [Chitinophagaceae bacterium]